MLTHVAAKDSVITSRFGRQLSGKSIVDEEPAVCLRTPHIFGCQNGNCGHVLGYKETHHVEDSSVLTDTRAHTKQRKQTHVNQEETIKSSKQGNKQQTGTQPI